MSPRSPRPKRILFEHTQGPTRGLMQIVGTDDEFLGRPMPECIEGFHSGPRIIAFASLVKVTPRFILYREAFPKPTGRFGQTIDGFHPDQR